MPHSRAQTILNMALKENVIGKGIFEHVPSNRTLRIIVSTSKGIGYLLILVVEMEPTSKVLCNEEAIGSKGNLSHITQSTGETFLKNFLPI